MRCLSLLRPTSLLAGGFLGLFLSDPGCLHAADLSFQDRVRAQEAIERVYYSYQIGARRSFEEAVPRHLLEKRVRTYLAENLALERVWETTVTAEMLLAEMERMAQGTRMPGRLRELYAALQDDPFLVQECLARPLLVGRLTRNFFSHDQTVHAEASGTARTLRERLLNGWIDPVAYHPARTVVSLVRRAPDAGSGRRTGRVHQHLNRRHETTRLELEPEEFDDWASRFGGRAGEIGPVVDERDRFVIRIALERSSDEIRLAEFVVKKRIWESWWEEIKGSLDVASLSAVEWSGGQLPQPTGLGDDGWNDGGLAQATSASSCADDTWDNGVLDDLPSARWAHTAVWTGSVMIVWGGNRSYSLDTGGRYDPATDSWAPTSIANAPDPREDHTAVWTGTQMIVWGGHSGSTFHNSGALYDPISDTWTPTTTANAPGARAIHTVIWTGSQMIIWGGLFEDQNNDPVYVNTGGRYDPATDAWSSLSGTNAPSSRVRHSVVWTGSSMIVWGGQFNNGGSTQYLDTGGQYDPSADSWVATSSTNSASTRTNHTAVWTGSQMLVWGGYDGTTIVDTGSQFDPITNSWSPISTTDAPPPRGNHSASWTGTRMIVWGGSSLTSYAQDTGGVYDPLADTWTPTSTTGAPEARISHTVVWTGSRMILWGGNGSNRLNTGGRYDPGTDTWTPTSTTGAPSPRIEHTAVWTGTHMLVWGGRFDNTRFRTGGLYDPVMDSWSPTTLTGAPPGRSRHTAVWTGDHMLVWGGSRSSLGGRYDPIADTWTPISTLNMPEPRDYHTAVWTGSHMVIWGGIGDSDLNTGGLYDPYTDTWTPTSTTGAPTARSEHAAVWTGARMVIWGGWTCSSTGGQYDPATDTWTPTSTTDAPLVRADHTAVWTGSSMLIWGGLHCGCPLQQDKGGALPDTLCYPQDTGGRYDPLADSWTSTSLIGAPVPRYVHTAIWTGSEMVVWGGASNHDTGGRYDPGTDNWTPTSMIDAPRFRESHSAVWTGEQMIVWGGSDTKPTNDGGRYCACVVGTYYQDADNDGFGDPGVSIQACGPPAGYVDDGSDCNDTNGMVWGTPTATQDLLFTDQTMLSWSPPLEPGGAMPLYDLLRSTDPSDFGAAATCVETASPSTLSNDTDFPAVGSVFTYLPRAETDCPGGGQGSLGSSSDGTPRTGRSCP